MAFKTVPFDTVLKASFRCHKRGMLWWHSRGLFATVVIFVVMGKHWSSHSYCNCTQSKVQTHQLTHTHSKWAGLQAGKRRSAQGRKQIIHLLPGAGRPMKRYSRGYFIVSTIPDKRRQSSGAMRHVLIFKNENWIEEWERRTSDHTTTWPNFKLVVRTSADRRRG